MSSGFKFDPEAESPRLGPTVSVRKDFIASLRKRHPIYGGLFAWLQRIAETWPLIPWAIGVGGLSMQLTLGGTADAEANAAFPILRYAVLLLYAVVTLLFWLARPLLNSLVRLHPNGRRVVSDNEVRESKWTVGYLVGAFACLILSFVPNWDLLQIPAFCLVLSVLPLQLVFRATTGPMRTAMVAVVAALGILTIMWPASVQTGEPDLERQFILWFWGVFIGAIGVGPLILRYRSQA